MIHTIIRDLDEEEMKTLIKMSGKLDIFFREGNEEDRGIWWPFFAFTMSQPA